MKNPIQNTALIAAFASIIGKMVYHLFFLDTPDFDTYSRFFYLFCFLAALLVGLRSWKIQHPGSPFTEDIKSGMKIASIYALVISAFTDTPFLTKVGSGADKLGPPRGASAEHEAASLLDSQR